MEDRSFSSTEGSPAAFFGDCAIRLTHRTSYEPPLYLFPELLPSVPQGAPPVTAWDAVADAVDVRASYWRIADYPAAAAMTAVDATTSTATSAGEERGQSSCTPAGGATPLTTLAALVASHRLLPAGLTQDALEADGFCASALLAELTELQRRTGLAGTPEGATLMTNHFVNLMAWRKLREANHAPASVTGRAGVRAAPGAAARVLVEGMRPSPDPWSRLVDDGTRAGTFIAGTESDVEERVEVLASLARLYGRPWRRLCSRGVQTDHVVPPGTLNPTSPYANPFREADARGRPGGASGPAQLRCVEELGWGPAAVGEATAPHQPQRTARYAVLVGPATARGAHGAPTRRVALPVGTTTFGRHAGPTYEARAGPVRVDVGLARFAETPAAVSVLHCAFIVRPVYATDVRACRADAAEDVDGADDRSESNGEKPIVLHRKTPTGFTLDVLSYGRNGIAVTDAAMAGADSKDAAPSHGSSSSTSRSRWLLGEVARLQVGSEVRIPGGVVLRILAADSEEVGDGGEALCVVKRERESEGDVSAVDSSAVPPLKAERLSD